MSNPLHLSLFYILVSYWLENASAFLCSTSSGEAVRGNTGGKTQGIAHHRAIRPTNTGCLLSSVSDEDTISISNPVIDNNFYFDVLQDAMNTNSTEASSVLLSKITEMRQNSEISTEETEAFLNDLLALGPDAPLPFWTVFRPLARISRRARMRSLRRTLNQITPDTDKSKEDTENLLRRRRLALVSLLRSLSGDDEEDKDKTDTNKYQSRRPAIRTLEKKAIRASKESASDLTLRRPEGLETPEYDVVLSGKNSGSSLGKNIEIRSYKPYSVCSVSMVKPRPSKSEKTDRKVGSPELKGASSFGALAGYLFGKNDQSTAMKMTTPVFTTNFVDNAADEDNNEQRDQTMAFVLPSDYWGSDNLSKAPMPLESSGVTLQERQSETRAVLMFGGYASKKEAERRKKELMSSLLKRESQWRPIEETQSLAQYNDPFTVPWRRVNEISVKVEEIR